MDDVVFVVMFYDKHTGLYDKLTAIYKEEIEAYRWILDNTEDTKSYKVECWKVN